MNIAEHINNLSAVDYANQGNSIIGIRGSGKTYTATKIAEQLMENNIPIVAFDPTGVWQYLRFGADGNKGYPVVVAGGLKPDIELNIDNCTDLLGAALHEGVSIIFDLQGRSTSTKSKWLHIVTACVEYLLEHNQEYGLRHIFFEEAAEFIPQRPSPGGAMAYSRIESLARQGRNYGLGYTVINQRAEEIAKAIFEISETVFVHRQTGKNSLKSIDSWLDYKGIEGKEIVQSLPKLENGSCWVIDQNGEQFIKVSPKQTFHPDPKSGKLSFAGNSPADISGFISRMKERMAAGEVNQPKKPVTDSDRNNKETEALKRRVEDLETNNALLAQQNSELSGKLARIANIVSNDIPIITGNDTPPEIIITARRFSTNVLTKPTDNKSVSQSGAMRMLKAAAMFYPKPVSKQRIATLANLSMTSGTFGTYIGNLKRDGYLVADGSGFAATESGFQHAGEIEPLPTDPAVLVEMWCNNIGSGSGAARILRYLADHYPDSKTKSDTGAACGLSHTSGSFGTYVGTLKRNGLITVVSGYLKAADELFN